MSVKVRCTGCEKVLTAPDSARGKAIRCPACETKVRVPAAKEKPKSSSKPADSEDALASLDLRQVEDRDARICGKCGYDMQHLDEDETECPKCGYDASKGGLGERAQKKRMKGPDPDKYYGSLWKSNWKFVFKNQQLAWRSMAYTLIASVLMFLCLFLYLYIPKWPPRVFFALCAFISGVMIPGWLWFMDQELIVATLQKKDKLKRINFDFFLCSALGVKFLMWNLVFAGPIVAIPALIGYVMTAFMGLPAAAFWVCLGAGYLPVMAMFPICMGHFVMPIQAPGWMFWKVFPAWFSTLKPTLIWVTLAIVLHLPVLGCVGTAAALYGPSINTVVQQMEENGAIYRVRDAKENGGKDAEKEFANDPLANKEYNKIDYSVFIVPGILWLLSCLFLGFPAMYISRLNGQFVYFFRESLDLQALAKEYKYVAKAPVDEDEELKPKTLTQVIVDAAVITAICGFVGLVAGMLMAAFSNDGELVLGMIAGSFWGAWFAGIVGRINLLSASFKEGVGWGLIVLFVPFGDIIYVATHWEDGAQGCLISVFAGVLAGFVLILAIAGVISMGKLGLENGGDDVRNAPADVEMMPADAGMMPADGEAAPGP